MATDVLAYLSSHWERLQIEYFYKLRALHGVEIASNECEWMDHEWREDMYLHRDLESSYIWEE